MGAESGLSVVFPGETLAACPYLCPRRVLRWIMKWIMQIPHNIFILRKVEVHAPCHEYTNKEPETAAVRYHLMGMVHIITPCFGSVLNLLNWLHL